MLRCHCYIMKFTGNMKEEDKAAIVEFLLQNYYIKENEAMDLQLNWYKVLNVDKTREIMNLTEALSNANRTIARLQSDVLYWQRLLHNSGRQVTYDAVARTIDYTSDETISDTESDDLMSQLMGEI